MNDANTKILVVDDEELIRLNVRALLEDRGYEVVEASDGKEGLDAFDREHPDLVLADLRMPVMDGLSMVEGLRERSPETPVIIISGTGTVRNAVDSLRLGAWDYIIKPVADEEGFEIIIKRVLEKAHLVKENRLYRERLEELVRERTEELRESETRYRRLLESVTSYVYSVTVRDDEVESTVHGPGCEAVTGFAPEEYAANPSLWSRMVDDNDKKLVADMAKRILEQSGPISFEHRIHHRDGSVRWVQNTLVPRRTSGGKLLSYDGIIEDITERKESEEKLFEATKRWERTFDAVPDLVAILDTTFNIVQVNKAMAERLGCMPGQCVGQSCYEAVHGAGTPPPFCPYVRTLEDSQEHTTEVSEGRLGGDFIVSTSPVYDSAGKMVGSVHIARDITERKRVEEEFRQYSYEIEDLYNNAPCGYHSLDRDGLILRMNDTELRWLGYAREEVVGIKKLTDILTAGSLRTFEESFSLLKDRGYAYDIEYEFVRKEGTVFPVLVSATAVMDQDGNYMMGRSTVYDISERKRTEEEKKRLETQLHQAQKVEAIGTLAGGIAHDFNNLLTVMTGYGTLLKMTMDEADPLKPYADQILIACDKAGSLTQSLLAFSRQQPINPNPLRINDVVKGTEKLLKRLITEDITLNISLAPSNIVAMADITQVDQILFNLATNARDAMQNGGTLTIETKLVEFDTEFQHFHGLGQPGRYALLSISDTGSGMDEKTKQQIFDPFFTTKGVGKGTGLGLSTVYGIVKQHNGYIDVSSKPGAGTTFLIYLPAITAAAQVEGPSLGLIKRGKETILIAEDNETVRRLMKDMLTRYGYTVIEAQDGEDAIDKFKSGKAIDLLILDSVMPKKSGREVYDEISRIKPGTKVLFTSGYTRDVVLEKGVEER